ncbi:protein dehydratase [Litorivita pollutaquae]|uniref:Protein dehydratase n=1 Tax=Litorivita pollutaquae TaxID=2200892 RepID=A0A2V4MJV9_9RHOB|nr:MaoC family dehydratase N-terminal domain-containing protein [Litorivita pollutaquae]PYC46911.1 protein dehydratase [Litorivita pollutaquae]
MSLDIDHLRSWIGNTETASETVTSDMVQRYGATLDLDLETGNGAIAPLFIHLCVAPPAVPSTEIGPDGHPKRGGFLPPVPLPRRMWAGGALTLHDDIHVGDVVSRHSTISDVTVKQGRSGTLCFVTVQHEISSGTRHVLSERQDIVYRDVDDPAKPAAPKAAGAPAAPAGAHRRPITPTPPLLFRYSALTFNGHRIHYDAPYARDVEGYPGLIVHGPLQATLLALYAEELRGARPAEFSFRSLSTIFDTSDFSLNASEDGEVMRLWTAQDGGPVAMEATAKW